MTDNDRTIEKAAFDLHMKCADALDGSMIAFKYGAQARDRLIMATANLREALDAAECAIAETAPPQDTHLTGRARLEQPWGER